MGTEDNIAHQKYLLENYLNDDQFKKKKKKNKKDNNQLNLKKSKRSTIVDEDVDGFWQNEEEDEDAPVLVAPKETIRKAFLSKKESGWKTLGEEDESLEDNKIEQEKELKEEFDEAIEDENELAPRMSNGTRAGLQTGAAVSADIKRQEIQIKKMLKKMDPKSLGRDAETIYRDSKGRKIDVEAERLQLERKKEEEEALEKARKERNQGLVQRQMQMERREALEKAKDMNFNRYKDDVELNEELKNKQIWNDPAANFLTKKTTISRYPQYQGSFPPNRYNIRPGYRWDGRDRSNGFEKKLFEKINAQKYKLQEAHAWSTEDM